MQQHAQHAAQQHAAQQHAQQHAAQQHAAQQHAQPNNQQNHQQNVINDLLIVFIPKYFYAIYHFIPILSKHPELSFSIIKCSSIHMHD